MDFDIQVAHSVAEVGEEAWNHLSGGRALSSFRWYRFGEAVLEECPPTYIILSHGSEPVARATFWLKRREWLPITSRFVRSGAEKMLYHWPLFSCETPLVSLSGLILPGDPTSTAALQTIAHTAQTLGKGHHASFTLIGYINHQEALQAGWPKAFSPIFYPDEETSLEITWLDFESYIKHLAKSTRRNYRLHCKKADELGIVVTSHSGVSEVDQVLTLIYSVDTYHNVGHRPWTRGILDNTGLVDSTWIAAHVGNRLVGCCSVIGDSGIEIATLLGLDYSFPEFIFVYYQIIYAAVHLAIENGAKLLIGGGGAYELKRRLGFSKLPDDYMMVAANRQWLQWLFRGAARYIGSQNADDKVQDNSEDPD
jgi:predicted N-acyltransferase